jgi:hypothetical protein
LALSGAVSSELIAVESARTIDRLRIQGSLTTEEAVKRIRVVNEWLEAIDLVLLPEMATHETALGAAARTFGFNVRGT